MGVTVFLIVVAALGLFLSWAFELQTTVLPSQEPEAAPQNLSGKAALTKGKKGSIQIQRCQALNIR